MRVLVGDQERSLPQSRKTRGLLAYLALADRRHRREDLCDLLWDLPDDPRASLRWSLTKLRRVLASGDDTVLLADRNTVALDRQRVTVDLLEIRALFAASQESPGDRDLVALENRFDAGGLNGLEGLGTRRFQLWLEAERKAIENLHRRILDDLVSQSSLSATERLKFATRRLALDPLHDNSNIDYLRLVMTLSGALEARLAFDRVREHYREENQPDAVLRAAWRKLLPPKDAAHTAGPQLVPADAREKDEVRELPDKPSLSVLDFSDLGSQPDGALLARGLTVDLNARLAQLPSLFVIARQSAARMAAAELPPRQVADRLGVRYLIGGSVQRHNGRVRATITLIDAADESEQWSEHFDRPLEHLFEVQDDITNSVIAAIEPAIERAEMQRALLKPPGSLSAWETYHRALWHCFRFTTRDNELAHELFRQAIAMDPSFARAHAGLSFTHYSRAFLDSVPDVDREVRQALEAGRKSIDFDGRDAMGHWSLGRALFLARQHDDALISIDNSLTVNPNYAHGHYARGFVGIHTGLDEVSLPAIDRAQRLSPYDPLLFAMKSSRAISLAKQGRYGEAASWAIRGTQEPNAHFHIYAIAAACLELAGRPNDAKNNARWVLDRRPDYSIEVFQRSFPYKDETSRAPVLAALARAGIPK